ncbi:hypothetical protein C4J83_5878 [Pseudomonas sp. LBUM920]|nr:hypothetical protein C4J83_5878 [Pseudomonas sp. LBUM920]
MGRGRSGWGGRVSESGGRCQQNAEQQRSNRTPGARWAERLGWRSGVCITCHAGRT